MKFASINIETNLHYDTLFSFLEKEKPEVICMQEVIEDDLPFLKEKIGMPYVFTVCNYWDYDNKRYNNIYGKRYGLAIFSKNILENKAHYYFGNEENTKVSFEEYLPNRENLRNFPFLYALVKGEDGKKYQIVTTHFPVTKHGESSPYQLQMLEPFFEGLGTIGDFVLCGDFNAPRGNETFTRIANRYKDNIPEHYKTSIDNNIHNAENIIMFVVDGLFTTDKYKAENVKLVDGVSDHMAVVAEIISNY